MKKYSVMIAAAVFSLFSFYLFARRGYYNLYIANKVMGSTAAVLAGITLLLYPLARFTNWADRFVVLGKPLGITALIFALFHGTISLFFLPNKFPLSWYQKEWIPVSLGVIAIGVWLFLAKISTTSSIKKLGSRQWRLLQSWGGRIAFLAIYGHLVIMKWAGWMKWWGGQVKTSSELANPSYPPASLFVFAAMTAVIAYRILLLVLIKK